MADDQRKTPEPYSGYEHDLTQELIAYYRLTASNITDAAQLELLLDELCSSDTEAIHQSQVQAREAQCRFVKNLLREREHVQALIELYDEAMVQAYAVGGDYYRYAATTLTELEAEAHAALQAQHYVEFENVLAKIKRIADQAAAHE